MTTSPSSPHPQSADCCFALNKDSEIPLSGKLDRFDQFYLAHYLAKK
jgi:hypothetical protein